MSELRHKITLWRQGWEIRRYNRRHLAYTVTLVEDVLDGGYVASVEQRRGCLSQGETAPEALRSIADALDAVLRLDAERSASVLSGQPEADR